MTYDQRYDEVLGVLEMDAETAQTRRLRATTLWENACTLADRGRWLATAKRLQPEALDTYADGYNIAKRALEQIQCLRSELSVRPYYRGEEEDYVSLASPYARLLTVCEQYGVTLDPIDQPEQDDHLLEAYDLVEVAF